MVDLSADLATVNSDDVTSTNRRPRTRAVFVALALAMFSALVWRVQALHFLRVWPVEWTLPIAHWVNVAIDGLSDANVVGDLTIKGVTRAAVPLLGAPIHWLMVALGDGYTLGFGDQRHEIVPPISWLGMTLALSLEGFRRRGPLLSSGALLTCVFLLVFGLWHSAMETISQLVFAIPISACLGLVAGIALHRRPRLKPVALLVLDLAQTVPIFSYLVPIIIFFGLGDVPALIAITVFAAPPMVRMTILGLEKAQGEVGELATSLGSTAHQALWSFLLPSAADALRLGFNQVVMLSFSTVILTSLVGAGGLGYDVLSALQQLALGRGLEAGLAITFLAILLDRFLTSMPRGRVAPWSQKAGAVVTLGLLLCLTLAGYAIPSLVHYPAAWIVSSAKFTDRVVDTLVDWTYDPLQAIQTVLVLHVFEPLKTLLAAIPWSFVVVAVAIPAYLTRGIRFAVSLAVPVALIALTNLWDKAVLTAFLCAGGVAISLVLGLPIGLVCGRVPAVRRIVRPVVDVLQTLPAFIYLIPVVMLLGNGDLPCIVAIASFAICPAIRYAEAAILAVPQDLSEAGRQLGMTSLQRLILIELPVSGPHLLLAVGQTVLMALAMVVVTALIGSSDLGHETIFAISKANPGQALVAGLAIATLGSVSDRLLIALASRLRAAPAGGH